MAVMVSAAGHSPTRYRCHEHVCAPLKGNRDNVNARTSNAAQAVTYKPMVDCI
jgi:hypothetical protein